MEADWVQHVREIGKKQAQGVVDALINNDHHLILKKRNGQEVDAGPIKVKPQGSVIFGAYTPYEAEPDIYVTKDGAVWNAAASQGRFHGGSGNRVDSGCWTGDRYLIPCYNYEDSYSSVLQSRDGGTWAFHPDIEMFNNSTTGFLYGMDASGTGVVVAVGAHFGPDEDALLTVSYDFGDTWQLLPSLDIELPSWSFFLEGVCIKNDFEWVITAGGIFWYTFDGGGHWAEITTIPVDFTPNTYYSSGIRWFNGYWWLFGEGYGTDVWDTVLIKSEDLVTWIPVVTPFSGTYPGVEAYYGSPHDSNSGSLANLEYDPSTNTVIGNGSSPIQGTIVIMSTDGGLNWFEVGFKSDESSIVSYGFKGIYKWPNDWNFTYDGGMAYGYGWWFLVNPDATPDARWPSMLRISTDGQITEAVYPSQQFNMTAIMVLSGGDVNF